MVDLTIYIVEANVLLLILALVYLIIKNQISLGQRRTLLIIIPFVSLLIPVLKIVNFQNLLPVYNLPVFDITQIQTGDISKINADHILAIPAYDRIYLSISLILALIWSLRIGYLIIHLKFKQHEDYNGLHILRIPDKNCFSFLRFIQLDPNLAYEAQEIVLEHEQVHVDKKHSYDIILMGLLRSAFWINPVAWLMRRELIHVHEYQVDQIMYNKYKAEYMEFLLSYSLGTSSNKYLLTNQFSSKGTLIKRMNFMKTKMKNKWGLALLIPAIASSFAFISWTIAEKQNPAINQINLSDQIKGEIEKMPEFKGGMEALSTYLSTNLLYPETARNNKIEGKVIISFMVEATGKVTNCRIKESAHTDLDKEALRVVSAMPEWIPGEKNGKKVNVEMTLPIVFKL